MLQLKNPFLSTVCARLRQQRPPYPSGVNVTVSTEIVDGSPFVRVWFRTAGCSYDKQGLCTMCNYGVGGAIPATIGDEISAALRTVDLDESATLLISPSGCMFDPREVPDEARHAILDAVRESPVGTVVCESRPETITPARVTEFAALLGGKTGVIELGLESADPWVLKWCVNKRMSLDRVREALDACHDSGVRSIANICVGTALLEPGQAITDAERATRWALDAGADACVLFPLQVRDWTLLGWLWRRGHYAPPSLWSLVEVLQRVTPDFPTRLSIAWYRDYNAAEPDAISSMRVLASPTTCPACITDVLATLDHYRAQPDPAVLANLVRNACECRARWQETAEGAGLDLSRLSGIYTDIGKGVLGTAWWESHGDRVLDDLVADYPTAEPPAVMATEAWPDR